MLTPDVLLEAEDAEEEILEDVEELGSYSPQSVSIDRSPESTAGDVEIVGEVVVLGLLGSQQPVSIERPSPEALSISPLEAEEETLEVVAVVGGDLGMFFTADRLDCETLLRGVEIKLLEAEEELLEDRRSWK